MFDPEREDFEDHRLTVHVRDDDLSSEQNSRKDEDPEKEFEDFPRGTMTLMPMPLQEQPLAAT